MTITNPISDLRSMSRTLASKSYHRWSRLDPLKELFYFNLSMSKKVALAKKLFLRFFATVMYLVKIFKREVCT